MPRWFIVFAALLVIGMSGSAAARADPTLYECPDSHAHVWNPGQCDVITPGEPIPSSGGGGHCGVVCGIGKVLGGLL